MTLAKVSKVTCFRAGRSVWHDRHVGIVEAAGSNPAPSTSFGKIDLI
jgi:hypothetical protein